jgi:hypothetical protein
MPFFPSYALAATWRLSINGHYLLVLTVTDEEDGRQSVIMQPALDGETLEECMALALSDFKRLFAL